MEEDIRDITALLNNVMEAETMHLQPLGKGWWSKAYSFSCNGEEWVIRFNRDATDFIKDSRAYDCLHEFNIPVPETRCIGKRQEFAYSITRKCPGYLLTDENVAGDGTVFKIFDALVSVRSYDPSKLPGWGWLNEEWAGQDESWTESLLNFHNRKMNYTMEGLWNQNPKGRELFQAGLEKAKALLPYCKTGKKLVHGDAGFDNLLYDGGEITGMLDWGEARLGDPLYDIAYLCFNTDRIPYEELWIDYCRNKVTGIQHSDEKLLCYQIIIGLNSLAIAEHAGNARIYESDRRKLEKLL